MTQKIFFITGEHSGDVLGASLMRSLKERGVTEFSGIGGPLMEEQGLESLWPMEELNVMGIMEVIWHLPRLLKLMEGVVAEIEKYNPDVVVTIDLPDFNFFVAKRLKKRGKCKAKLVHYVAPSVWAWRPGRAKKIAQFLDGLICLFPHEPPYFTKHGLRAEYIGHPLIENDPDAADGPGFRERFQIPPDAPVLGVFFGSRTAELDKHSDVLKETITIVREAYPDLHVVVPTVAALEYEVRKVIENADYPVFVLVNPDDKWDEFAACDVAVAVSGTVGLELAYMGIPHVVVYKMHPLSWILLKMMLKTKYAHLANILLGEQAIPEYLQGKCKSLQIGTGILKLFKDENERKAQRAKTEKLREFMKVTGERPSMKAADFTLRVLTEPAPKRAVVKRPPQKKKPTKPATQKPDKKQDKKSG